MITFKSGSFTHTLNDNVKDFTYEELEEVFKGKLDYVTLAKELGIKKVRKPKKVKEEE